MTTLSWCGEDATFGRGLVLTPEFTVEGLYSSLETPDLATVQRDLDLPAPVRVIDMSLPASAARPWPQPPDGHGLDDDPTATTQCLLVRTYLTEEGGQDEIEQALFAVLDSVGLDVEWMSRPQHGSSFRRYLIRVKGSAEAREQLAKIERAWTCGST